MHQITESALLLWKQGRRTKSTPSGWISGNAPCCQHRGERPDTRSRGGFMVTESGGFTWHCFNCGFKAGWSTGKLISSNTKLLLKWLGMSDSEISRLNLLALKLKEDLPTAKPLINYEIQERPLPDDCRLIDDWVADGCQDPDLLAVIDYVVSKRKMEWEWYPWHWSAANGYRDRVIIPFYHEGKIAGYTGRKIKEGKPKYLSDVQPGYVFNLDRQDQNRKYIIVVEGQFDAIAVDGVAVMHNEPNPAQCSRINAMAREVIVVPDRDRAGAKLITAALEHGWSVSMPPWEERVKDVADAVKRYGRLYTLQTILHYRETNQLKIKLLMKHLENEQT